MEVDIFELYDLRPASKAKGKGSDFHGYCNSCGGVGVLALQTVPARPRPAQRVPSEKRRDQGQREKLRDGKGFTNKGTEQLKGQRQDGWLPEQRILVERELRGEWWHGHGQGLEF